MRVKKRYVYYKCTNHGKTCTEGYYREDDLAPQFAEIVREVSLAPEVVDWVKNALKASLEDETAFHDAALVRLTEELDKVKRRMNQAYLDKVDGKIDEDFWAECSANWQAEKYRILDRLSLHEKADDRYFDEGARLLNLAQRVSELYGRQDPAERQRLLVTILEQCTIQNGLLTPKYRPPWDVIARMSGEKEPPPAKLNSRGRRSSRIESWGG